MYVCMYVCVYVCMYVCTYVCMCVYVCMYDCMCIYVYVYRMNIVVLFHVVIHPQSAQLAQMSTVTSPVGSTGLMNVSPTHFCSLYVSIHNYTGIEITICFSGDR